MAARANEYSQGKVSGLRVAPSIVREFEMDVHTLPYLKWITNKDFMYRAGSSARHCVAAWMGEGWGRKDTCVCMSESLPGTPEMSQQRHNVVNRLYANANKKFKKKKRVASLPQEMVS